MSQKRDRIIALWLVMFCVMLNPGHGKADTQAEQAADAHRLIESRTTIGRVLLSLA